MLVDLITLDNLLEIIIDDIYSNRFTWYLQMTNFIMLTCHNNFNCHISLADSCIKYAFINLSCC